MLGPQNILQIWRKFESAPFGKTVFSSLLGRMVPYTGSIRPKVLELEPGHCLIEMKDRRSLRNHLNSIHAVALVNLGEVVSGLPLVVALPEGSIGIPVHFEIDYIKKARGTLQGLGSCKKPSRSDESLVTRAEIFDEQKDLVASFEATWKLKHK